MRNRQAKLEEALQKEGIDALILTKPENQRYLEGFTGTECYMLASAAGNWLIADSRYTEMGERECRSAKVLSHRPPHPPCGEVLAGLVAEHRFARVGFEGDHIGWSEYESFANSLRETGAELIPTTSLMERIRARKEPQETAMIGAACQIADRALRDLLPCIRPGVSELDLKIELDYRLKTGGAENASFDTMVLFGARASQPHANARGDVRLRKGDFVLIDYGAVKEGYRSDTTRTFVCGSATDEQKAAYDAVLRSQRASLAMVAPGANGKEINERALAIIRESGFPAFAYGIGHGVGLEIHEEPFLRQSRDTWLEADMVVTIEPGIYKPGWGGIRIEDTVLVTEGGGAAMTFFPKELMEL